MAACLLETFAWRLGHLLGRLSVCSLLVVNTDAGSPQALFDGVSGLFSDLFRSTLV